MRNDRRHASTATPRPVPPAAATLISDKKKFWKAAAAVLLLTAAVHYPGLDSSARHVDDAEYLEHNPLVQSPSTATAWRFMSEVLHPSSVGGYYHPLTMISFMLDYAAGGRVDNLAPFHRTSLLLHLGATAGVLLLLHLLFDNLIAAALVALLFGVHPLTVETVVWMGARKAVLAGCFCVWTLVFYAAWVRTRRWSWYAAACLAMILALLSKPTALPLAVLLVVLDAWPLKRFRLRTALHEKIPFYLITAVFLCITWISHRSSTVIEMPPAYALPLIPVMICYKSMFGLAKIICPVGLSAYYEPPTPFTLADPRVLAALAAATALAVAVMLSGRRTRAFAAGLLFYLIAFSPMAGSFKYGANWVFMFDNYLYIPMLGIALMAAAALARTAQPGAGTAVAKEQSTPGTEALTICAVFILAAAVVSNRYMAKWQETEGFYSYMLEKYPEAGMLHNHLGLERARLVREERMKPSPSVERALTLSEQSIDALRLAARFTPDTEKTKAEIETNLGASLWQGGDLLEALGHPKEAEPYKEEAVQHLRRGLELNWGDFVAHFNLAKIYENMGRTEDALAKYRDAFDLHERHSKLTERIHARLNHGDFLRQLGRLDEAGNAYMEVLKLKPDHPEARQKLDELQRNPAPQP